MRKRVNHQKSSTDKIVLFISHSAKNVKLVKLIIEIIRLGLNLSANSIRCTSLGGHKLSAGVVHDEQLRKDIVVSRGFISVVTPDSINSPYVIFETGARWGRKKHLIPFIASKSGYQLLEGPLKNMHALNGCKREDIFQLVNELAILLNIEPEMPSVYIDKVEKLVRLTLLK
jgi:hypothetical protein